MEEFHIKGCLVKFFFDKENEEIKINVSHPKSIVSYETSIDLNNFNNSNVIESNFELIYSYFSNCDEKTSSSNDEKNSNKKRMFEDGPGADSQNESSLNNDRRYGFILVGSVPAKSSVPSISNKNTHLVFPPPDTIPKTPNPTEIKQQQLSTNINPTGCCWGNSAQQSSTNIDKDWKNNIFKKCSKKKDDIEFHLDFGALKITFVRHSISIFLKEKENK